MAGTTDFDHWLAEEYIAGATSGFTALVMLLRLKNHAIKPQSSTYLHVIGTEVDWGEVSNLLAGAGKRWDAAVFFVRRDASDGGPLDTTAARLLVLEQEAKVAENRLVINQGHFFDAWGRRMKVEELKN